MKDDKTFFKIMISYVSIILLTVTFIGASTVTTLFTKLESDTEKLNDNIMAQTQQIFDSELRAVLTLPHQLLENDEFKAILSMSYSNQSDKIYKSWQAIKKMYKYQTGYTSVRNVAVYVKKSNFILESDSIYSKKEYYNTYFKDTDLTYDKWLQYLNKGNFTHFFISTKTNRDNISKDVFIYCQGLRRETPDTGGLLMAIVDKEEILDKLRLEELNNTIEFAAVDRNGECFFKTDGFDIKLDKKNISGETGSFNAKKYKVVYRTSDVMDIKYVYLLTRNNIFGSVGYVLPMFLLILILAIAVSVIAANFSAKRMQRSILAILDENKLLAKDLSEYVTTSRDKLFLNLLYNIPLKEDEKEKISAYCTNGNAFRALLIKGTERDNFDVYNERIATAWTEADSILTSMLSGANIGVYSLRTAEATYVYILSYGPRAGIEDDIEKTIKRFVEEYGICLTAAVGREVADIEEINISYEEAMYASRYNNAEKNSELIFGESISDNENRKLHYTVEKEQLLVRNIKTGKTSELEALFDEIYTENFVSRKLTQEMLKRLVLHILLMVFKILDDAYEPEDKQNEYYVRVCQNILHNDNAEEAFNTLREICLSISKKLPEQKGKMQLERKIESYIAQNYSDMDLSLDTLAEHIGLSYNYLSKVFKEFFGTNFVSYVTAIRLEKAKELLKTTNLPIERIAQDVGFGRSNSFIKIFKKYYNVTPGQFRSRNMG